MDIAQPRAVRGGGGGRGGTGGTHGDPGALWDADRRGSVLRATGGAGIGVWGGLPGGGGGVAAGGRGAGTAAADGGGAGGARGRGHPPGAAGCLLPAVRRRDVAAGLPRGE